MADGLEKEQKLFDEKKPEWMKTHANQWVWIHGADSNFYPSFEDAVRAAYKAGFDKQPIFVKQLSEKEEQPTVAGYYDWAV